MESFKKVIKKIITSLYIKNPCKKCLVRACCSQTCEKKNYYISFCFPFNSIFFNRLIAYSLIFDIFGVSWLISYQLYKLFN